MGLDFEKLWKEAKKVPKGFHFKKTNIENATHWLAYDDENESDSITPYQFYRLYLDKYDDEYIFFDDNGVNTTAYMWHNGEFVILERIEKV